MLIKKKYRSLLTAGMIAMLVEYIVLLSDNIIVGQMIGADGLSAITLVTPFFMLIVFFNMILVTGTSVGMSTEIGQMNEKRANELFSNGSTISVVLGAVVTVAAIFMKPVFLHEAEVSPEVYQLAVDYYNGLIPLPLIMILNNVLYECITNVGNEKLCEISSLVQVVSNIGLSIVLCYQIGIFGVGLATTISTFLALLVLFLHFIKKDNPLKFKVFFSLKDFISCCRFGFFDSSKYLYTTIFTLIVNTFIVMTLDETWLSVFCVVISVQNLIVAVLDSVGNALQPLVSIYEGENNTGAMRRVVRMSEKTTIAVGLIITAVLMFGANLFVNMLGITDPVTVQRSVVAVRITCASSLLIGLMLTLANYYLCRSKILLASFITFIQNFSQLTLVLIVGFFFGATGMWLGITLAPVLAIILTAVIIIAKYKKDMFPFLLSREELESWACFDGESTAESVMKIVYDAEEFLKKKNIEKKFCLKTMLLLEETGMSIVEWNTEKPALIECCVYVDPSQIKVVLRDNGKRTDVTDEDREISSMQAYLSSRIIGTFQMKSYLQATGFNRSVFSVPLTPGEGAIAVE